MSSPSLELSGAPELGPLLRRRLVELGESTDVEPGGVLYRQGEPSDGFYFVLAGAVRLTSDATAVDVAEEGDLVGLLDALTPRPRSVTATALEEVRLLHLGAPGMEQLLQEIPEAEGALREEADRHFLRRELRRRLPAVVGEMPHAELAELVERFRPVRLNGGERLFSQGEDGDAAYVLISGRLGAFVEQGGDERMVGEIGPGEWVGEMALLTGESRSAGVVALRDSILQACDKSDFEAVVERHPQLLRDLSRLLIRRLTRANRRVVPGPPRMTMALVPLQEGLDVEAFARPFVKELERFGSVVRIDRSRVASLFGVAAGDAGEMGSDLHLLPWLEEQESAHDVVIYEAGDTADPWALRCVRQADRVVLLADAERSPVPGTLEHRLRDAVASGTVPFHLVLLHPPECDMPEGTREWLDPRDLAGHHHARTDRPEDVGRVARLVTGRGIGLALSGGGARGCAHIGVFGAFQELGIPVDVVGGTSAGAALGAKFAMGRPWSRIHDETRKLFVDERPFRTFTLPFSSLVGRRGLDHVCHTGWGELDLTDFWRPFLCVACDLQTGEKVIMDRGPAWKTIRASMSLPGIVPPVAYDGRLLVDGGVVDNLPEEEVKEICGGPLAAVNVAPADPIAIDYEYEDTPGAWELVWSRINPFSSAIRAPGMLEVLARTATVSDARQRDVVEEVADIILRPPVSQFGLLDFPALDEIVRIAHEYSVGRLEEWAPLP